MIEIFKTMIVKINNYINSSAKDSSGQMISFGIFGIIAYPIFYFINLYLLSPQDYANLSLRIIAGLLCLGLIFNKSWPLSLRKYLPIYWYFTLLFGLPFFFTFMSLKNHLSTAWIINSLIVSFIFMLLVDWVNFVILIFMGSSLGILFYYFVTPQPFNFKIQLQPVSFMDLFTTFVVSVIMGVIFSRNREKIEKEKLEVMKSVGETIAHELRTPLRIASSSAAGLNKYLPELIETYDIAKQANLPVPRIDKVHYGALKSALDNITSEIESAFNVINMLLIKADYSNIEANTAICSITDCIDKALSRYPFDLKDHDLVHWDHKNDFLFKGDESLIIHVLFNLLKNAIYYIKVAGKGEITIWLEVTAKWNVLHFKDTGQGIPAKILPRIFDRFFSSTHHGAGIGLSYCKMVMQNLGGNIICISKEFEYTEFILFFPKELPGV